MSQTNVRKLSPSQIRELESVVRKMRPEQAITVHLILQSLSVSLIQDLTNPHILNLVKQGIDLLSGPGEGDQPTPEILWIEQRDSRYILLRDAEDRILNAVMVDPKEGVIIGPVEATTVQRATEVSLSQNLVALARGARERLTRAVEDRERQRAAEGPPTQAPRIQGEEQTTPDGERKDES